MFIHRLLAKVNSFPQKPSVMDMIDSPTSHPVDQFVRPLMLRQSQLKIAP